MDNGRLFISCAGTGDHGRSPAPPWHRPPAFRRRACVLQVRRIHGRRIEFRSERGQTNCDPRWCAERDELIRFADKAVSRFERMAGKKLFGRETTTAFELKLANTQ